MSDLFAIGFLMILFGVTFGILRGLARLKES